MFHSLVLAHPRVGTVQSCWAAVLSGGCLWWCCDQLWHWLLVVALVLPCRVLWLCSKALYSLKYKPAFLCNFFFFLPWLFCFLASIMLKPGAADTFYTRVSVSALCKILCAKSRFCTRTENTRVLWGCYEELRHVSFWEEREKWEGSEGGRWGGAVRSKREPLTYFPSAESRWFCLWCHCHLASGLLELTAHFFSRPFSVYLHSFA